MNVGPARFVEGEVCVSSVIFQIQELPKNWNVISLFKYGHVAYHTPVLIHSS